VDRGARRDVRRRDRPRCRAGNPAAEWLLYLDGKNDWEIHLVPAAPR